MDPNLFAVLISRARGHGQLPPEVTAAIESSPIATDLAAVALGLAGQSTVDWSALVQVIMALTQILLPLLVPKNG